MQFRGAFQRTTILAAMAGLALPGAAFAQPSAAPVPPPADLLPPAAATPAPTPAPTPVPPPPAPSWPLRDARALLATIQGIGSEGLDPKDYEPATLAAAIAAGEGVALNDTATRLFAWLVEDMRDGRTPMAARVQWFAVDPDRDINPTALVLARALEQHDVPGQIAALAPLHPDYAQLKRSLAEGTGDKAVIRANMDRWRWLARDMGKQYLLTNVPEYTLRLTVNNRVITSYRTVVGKPGKTATPQLAETVQGVIFNPTWTVPQSIVKGEGLGAKVLANPGWAKAAGYKGIKDPTTGFVTVVQQPGKNNSLGLMKLDMPNPHAIFVHDTPAKSLFAAPNRAFSHGCIRTERASELGMLMAMLGGGLTKEEGVAHTLSGVYTKVPMTKTFPIYITYFTMASDVGGGMRKFADIYGRDAPVLASFKAPRQLHTDQRTSSEKVIEIVDDLGAV
ncbi:L,D-transpeptidase family protein [Novosphingobium sp. Gsoil 351]|uniref:L,D-transpeptidase family protein n=1 Tax=Novosphingobium sp. Gsoil 351 TaxID=2675225 RepID=UPI0012B4FB23|nr:L,D-transpeptidase family protein [Novosphingobium sp. Gsoil 351]QGN55150.1 L,D-transpeptidase family protein [Novosphingobium sp. Gsoil 351]